MELWKLHWNFGSSVHNYWIPGQVGLTRYRCVLYPNYVAVIYISVELWISLPLHVKKAYNFELPLLGIAYITF
jgi:hypothetical protein